MLIKPLTKFDTYIIKLFKSIGFEFSNMPYLNTNEVHNTYVYFRGDMISGRYEYKFILTLVKYNHMDDIEFRITTNKFEDVRTNSFLGLGEYDEKRKFIFRENWDQFNREYTLKYINDLFSHELRDIKLNTLFNDKNS